MKNSEHSENFPEKPTSSSSFPRSAPDYSRVFHEMGIPVLFDAVIPLGGYYLLRATGFNPFLALLLCAIPTTLYQLYQISRNKKINFLAVFILFILVVSVILSFVTGSVRLMLAKEGWFTGIVGLFFLSSLLLKRPMAYSFAGDILEKFSIPKKHLEKLWHNEPRFRKTWRVSTIIWGMGTLCNATLLIVFAYTLPVDIVPVLGTFIPLSTFVLLQIITQKYYQNQGIWKMVFHQNTENSFH